MPKRPYTLADFKDMTPEQMEILVRGSQKFMATTDENGELMSTDPDEDDLPAPAAPSNPAEVLKVMREQAVLDFARALGLPLQTARALGEHAWGNLERTMPLRGRAHEQAAAIASQLRRLDPASVARAVMRGGLGGARAEINRQIGAENAPGA